MCYLEMWKQIAQRAIKGVACGMKEGVRKAQGTAIFHNKVYNYLTFN